MFKLVLEKAEEPDIKLPTSAGSWKKQKSFKKHILLLYWLCQSICLCGSQKTVENSERDGKYQTQIHLFAGKEATVRTGHRITDWFQIEKGVHQGYILSPCWFNLYAEYIMWNVRQDEAEVGIKIARRNINNLRYADDTTLLAENKEELKSLLMKMKEESGKCWLKTQHSEN